MILAQFYQHFRSEEKTVIDKLIAHTTMAIDQYRPVVVPFLDPRGQFILKTIVNTIAQNAQIKVQFFAPNQNAERKRAVIYPDYFKPQADDFECSVLTINYPQKFATLSHRAVLGSLLGAGIDRSVLGDIVRDDITWQVVVDKKMQGYLQTNVDHVGKINVSLIPTVPDKVLPLQEDGQPESVVVSSMRLDCVISAVAHYSRNRVKELIKRQLVSLNYVTATKPQQLVAVHDIISIRHFGRIKLVACGRHTKKDKQVVEVLVIKNK